MFSQSREKLSYKYIVHHSTVWCQIEVRTISLPRFGAGFLKALFYKSASYLGQVSAQLD
jgi:hypothetical protein